MVVLLQERLFTPQMSAVKIKLHILELERGKQSPYQSAEFALLLEFQACRLPPLRQVRGRWSNQHFPERRLRWGWPRRVSPSRAGSSAAPQWWLASSSGGRTLPSFQRDCARRLQECPGGGRGAGSYDPRRFCACSEPNLPVPALHNLARPLVFLKIIRTHPEVTHCTHFLSWKSAFESLHKQIPPSNFVANGNVRLRMRVTSLLAECLQLAGN